MNIKVEFRPRPELLALDSARDDTWHGFTVVFSLPNSRQAIVSLPDDWDETRIAAWMEMRVAEGEIVDWRHEHTDYHPLWIPSLAVAAPQWEIGDTFALHGLTAQVRDLGNRGQGVLVGICDTGVDSQHAAFWGIQVSGAGKDQDSHGHGTHVASTAASNWGIANLARIYAGWALPLPGGGGSESSVSDAIRGAADAGAAVINLSLGGGLSQVIDSACDYAKAQGCVVVVAAGNTAGAPIGSPARAADIIVMAHDRDRVWASFTSGRNWDNPNRAGWNGVQVRAAQAGSGSGSIEASGTSMATPHLAGAVALLRAAGLSRVEAINYVLGHRANPPDGPGSNIFAADFVVEPPVPVPPPAPPAPGQPYYVSEHRTTRLSDGQIWESDWNAVPPPGVLS